MARKSKEDVKEIDNAVAAAPESPEVVAPVEGTPVEGIETTENVNAEDASSTKHRRNYGRREKPAK